MNEPPIPRALTIAGSDSGGGAGIQADLKTFTALNVYGMSAVTALTAQNTQTVAAVHPAPAEFVRRQINLVCSDIGVDAAKTGMLFNKEIVEAVAEAVEANTIPNLVLDPVMYAKSGDALLQEDARSALKNRLIPLAHVITPNAPEAEELTGVSVKHLDDMKHAAEKLHALGPKYVLLKGGHLDIREAVDILFDGRNFHAMSAPRIHTPNTHGTGCTYSAAIAAFLARRLDPVDAVNESKLYLHGAIENNLALGRGHGPLNHMWQRLD